MSDVLTPIEIFCCYAHEDETWLRRLEIHLSLLKRQAIISIWYDRLILPGTDWAKTIDAHLETASLILLLISSDFLASGYTDSIEMKRALQRHEANEAYVIPVLLRPVDWQGTSFAHLQALPTDAKPITSWIDPDSALDDVAAGIRRAIESLSSASAPRTALPHVWNIPYPRNPFFTGREEVLIRLADALKAGQSAALSQPQAISGLGGIGKTQIAIEYAYRYHQEYEAVLWARAENLESLTSSYNTIATLLNLPEREASEQDITIQAVKMWLQTHRKWLLILDNADELTLLLDFLPPNLGGHLLLTTRAAAIGRLARRLEVETLLPKQGALFLLRRAGLLAFDATLEQASPQERDLALQICQELGGLPLALDQAGAYLEETGIDLISYWQIYQQHRGGLLQERRGLASDHPHSVATTWSLSFQRVEMKNPAAADLLRLCAFLAPDAISESIITKGASYLGPLLKSVVADPFLLNQAVEALRAYSLIRRDSRTKSLSVHRLVQAVLLDSMEENEQKMWKQRVVQAVYASSPNVQNVAQWEACEQWLPHAQVCATWIEQEDMMLPEAAHLLNVAGYYLGDRARYKEAGPLYWRALSISERQLGPEHPNTALSLNNLALLYQHQGKYAETEPLYKRALAIYERQLGAQHPDTATSLNNLAALYRIQGKYEQAEPLLLHALAIREQQLGPTHPDTATSLNNLAEFYQDQGNYERADPLLQRALAIDEKILGSQHPAVATDLNNLAELYRAQGKYEQAEPLYKRALTTYERHLGPEHPNTAISLNNLAELYRAQGKYEQAEPLYKRALTTYERQLGPEHPNTLAIRRNYSSLLHLMGDLPQ